MIHRISTMTVPELWPLVQEHAQRALKYHPFLEAEDLLTIMLAGHAQLFIATHEREFVGFAAMEVIPYPRRNVANVVAAGGNKGFLSVCVQELIPALEAWAREHGADTFAAQGRPGWLRVAKGFEGSKSVKTGWAWRQLDERRREPEPDDPSNGTVGGRTTIPSRSVRQSGRAKPH